MRETRRNFFVNLAFLTGSLALTREISATQNPPTPPPPPAPAQIPNQTVDQPYPGDLAAAKRSLLLQNEKEFREGVERLYQLTSRLRDELQKTPTADIFSVRIVKETEEIEKLAKSLKSKAKSA